MTRFAAQQKTIPGVTTFGQLENLGAGIDFIHKSDAHPIASLKMLLKENRLTQNKCYLRRYDEGAKIEPTK
jgi:hypothetical protein